MMLSLSWHDMIPSEDEDLGVAEGDNNDVREVGDQHQPSKNICGLEFQGPFGSGQ